MSFSRVAKCISFPIVSCNESDFRCASAYSNPLALSYKTKEGFSHLSLDVLSVLRIVGTLGMKKCVV